MTNTTSTNTSTFAPEVINDEFTPVWARTKDDYQAVRLRDVTYLIEALEDGTCKIYSAYHCSRSVSKMERKDFRYEENHFKTRDALAQHVKILSHHHRHRQRHQFGRRQIYGFKSHNPWGEVQHAESYNDDGTIVSVSTASHGGIWVADELNNKIHHGMRNNNGWYEEDCEWSIVALTFPQIFTDFEREIAEGSLRDYYPETWEYLHGRKLQSGQSRKRDEKMFQKAHANDWIVISAVSSSYHEGMVEVVATLGGDRSENAQEKRFLVPDYEYRTRGRFGFIINLEKHSEYHGQSDFISYQRKGILS